jgi:cytochrome P450
MATFGMGVHFCLGYPLYMMEAKVLLALIARGYDVANVGEGPAYWGVSPMTGFGGRTKDVHLKFSRRQ